LGIFPEMSERKLKFAFLISGISLYSLLTLIIWPDRFYYDDEWINLRIISKYSFSEILSFTSKFDFHPPLQYIINKVIYVFFGPNEWLMSIPSILSIGLAAGLAGIIVYELSGSKGFSFFTILLACSHPAIQMWGWSIRWYPLWSFFIIVSLYFSLRIWRERKINYFDSAIVTLCLVLAIYTNYQTIIVLLSLILTAFFVDLIKKNFNRSKFYHTNTVKTILITSIVIIFFLPWITALDFHLSNYFIQKNLLKNFIDLGSITWGSIFLFTIIFGTAVYPWDIVFIIIFAAISFSALISGAFILFLRKDKIVAYLKLDQEFISILIFLTTLTVLFFLMNIFSDSLQNKGNIVISFLIVIVITYGIFFINKLKRPDTKNEFYVKRLIRLAIIIFILINCYSTFNIIRREHFHKMGLSDPIPETVTLLVQKAKENSDHQLIVTINPVLTYYLLWNGELENTDIISPYLDDAPIFLKKNKYKSYSCKPFSEMRLSNLIFVESYIGSLIPLKEEYKLVYNYIKNNGIEVKAPVYLGEDTDLHFKRRIFPNAGLKKFRFIISFFKPASEWDLKQINKIIEKFSSEY